MPPSFPLEPSSSRGQRPMDPRATVAPEDRGGRSLRRVLLHSPFPRRGYGGGAVETRGRQRERRTDDFVGGWRATTRRDLGGRKVASLRPCGWRRERWQVRVWVRRRQIWRSGAIALGEPPCPPSTPRPPTVYTDLGGGARCSPPRSTLEPPCIAGSAPPRLRLQLRGSAREERWERRGEGENGEGFRDLGGVGGLV